MLRSPVKPALNPFLSLSRFHILQCFAEVIRRSHCSRSSVTSPKILRVWSDKCARMLIERQPAAQRNREAILTNRIDAATNKFKDYGLIDEMQIGAQPAIQPKLVMLVIISRDELERFNTLLGDLIVEPNAESELGDSQHTVAPSTDEESGVACHG